MCFSKSKTVNAVYIICCVLLAVSIFLLPFNKINYSALIVCITILLVILAIGITNNTTKQQQVVRRPPPDDAPAPAEQSDQTEAVRQKQLAPVRMAMPMQPRRDMALMRPQQRDMALMRPQQRDIQCERTPPPAVADVPGNIMQPPLHVPRRMPLLQQPPLLLPVQMESAPLTLVAKADDGAKRDGRNDDDVAQCGPGFTVVPPQQPRAPPSGPQIVPNLPPFPGVVQYTGESMWRLPEWPVNQPSREESIAAVVPDLPTCSSNQASKNAIRNQGLYGIKGNVSCDLLKRSAVADTGFLQPLGARNAFLAYNTYDQLHSKDQFMIPVNKQQF
jgi:hypothetical protein